jgi:glycosyltransferase involved in cell wall biosynthesis
MGGGGIRQAFLLTALARQAETHLLVAGSLQDDELRRELAGVVEVPCSPKAPPKSRLARRVRDLAGGVMGREAREVAAHAPVRRAFTHHLQDTSSFDYVCIEYISLAPLLPERRSNRWTITFHNLISRMAAQAANAAPTSRHRWLYGRDLGKAASLERWAADRYDRAFVVSEDDANELPGHPYVVPNGVDTDAITPSPLPSAPRMIFTGAFHTLPNYDGAQWFCEDVLPLVRSSIPDARLQLVGMRPGPEVRALVGIDGVELHPDVPDVRPYLRDARVAVVPLRVGTGTRLKALEAMAAGRPVVGTSLGLGGLGLVPGRHALFADDAAQFAHALTSVLRDDALAMALAREGRTLVADRFGWDRIGELFVRSLFDGWEADR